MYLQIRKRKLKRRPGVTLEFVLIESFWEAGRTKKSFIKYLGSIKKNSIPNMSMRVVFWDKVYLALTKLDLPEHKKASVERDLREIVPEPDQRDRQRYFEMKASIEADRKASKQDPGRPGPKGKREKMVITRRYSKQYPGG